MLYSGIPFGAEAWMVLAVPLGLLVLYRLVFGWRR
jgi:hypothetical protein